MMFLLIFLFLTQGFVLWMFINCATRENFPEKTKWILLIIFLNWIAALFYYFKVKRKLDGKNKN